MQLLPTTLLELLRVFTVVGGVPLLVGAAGYVGKKVVDVVGDLVKARLSQGRAKHRINIYGPDETIVKQVDLDSR